MSSWDVQFTSTAIRRLDKLPPRIAAAIAAFITTTLPENPPRMSKPLRGDLEGYRSARRGDYRVLLELDEERRCALVIRIAHRADACRPL